MIGRERTMKFEPVQEASVSYPFFDVDQNDNCYLALSPDDIYEVKRCDKKDMDTKDHVNFCELVKNHIPSKED